ncbi:MAG: ATP-binding cassette domain-containing protein [Arthrobacter sp.]
MTFPGAVLDICNLSVGYGGLPVCGPITARADAGEILGVVGFNGAGKSTAARTIAGKQQMLDGEVRVHGLPVNEDAIPFRRQAAALFDEDAFFPSLSLREHLQLVPAATRSRTRTPPSTPNWSSSPCRRGPTPFPPLSLPASDAGCCWRRP